MNYVRDFDDQPRSALLLDGAHALHSDLSTAAWPISLEVAPFRNGYHGT